ncbi:Ras-like GTP-binding protein A [Thecamonas trahens ATCC 50062]|uniref:Ras-like GTP-binding protein A n=1 Tax=Thecamonas trahens ATCC 50062 TaxID=461836 RepID=A0A0L0D1T3_THETB|nr:Ras-like GTP-binding protein A [Thecamonas trahens ATCC 50062]KNC46060.1 Ras-like GTP-binding protein A [Thecamonas trahens ATCC 50062]|eukprot:XP_013763040.1 Ras-like GTP-binding protein A [Thecamonas trahens ATCC 50062]
MKSKVLLMGKSSAGKTSMRSIIFANYIARDTMRLGATIDVEHSHVRFLGNLVLNLWDCGGQASFMENYFTSQREHIFKNVEVLIYVFDVQSDTKSDDIAEYTSCLEAIREFSPDAKVFCLVHKMDLIPVDQRDAVFAERSEELQVLSEGLSIACHPTSIWDETLYRAWSAIVYSLIPNISVLEAHLENFCEMCEADEVVLFERATFLVISHATRKTHHDEHRFEKISNSLKSYKLCCSKSMTQFDSIEIRNSKFAAFLDKFTSNTCIMVIMSDPTVSPTAMDINIQVAKSHFEAYVSIRK